MTYKTLTGTIDVVVAISFFIGGSAALFRLVLVVLCEAPK